MRRRFGLGCGSLGILTLLAVVSSWSAVDLVRPRHASAATAQPEIQLQNDQGAASDMFGGSVAISGNTAIVGAPGRSEARVYVRNGPTWSQQGAALTPSDGVASFGKAVAISGDTAVIGAVNTAYVFVRSGETWSQRQILTASDGIVGDHFGDSVAITSNTVIVGAPFENGNRGAAYVFVRGATWTEQQKLTATAAEANDGFGWSVGISGETAIVGVFGDNVFGDTSNREGSAYVFVRNGATWSGQAVLTSNDVAFSFGFGWSVAISGDTATVGTHPGYAAFVFTRTGSTWSSAQDLLPNPGEAFTGDGYGESVSVSGDRIIVGAFNSANGRGAAYRFVRSVGSWSEERKLTASDAPAGSGAAQSSFGASVAVSGPVDIVGAPLKQVGANHLQGGAYLFPPLDTDGDGLPDEWETVGVTIDDVFIDLPAMGADPRHKDIFIHADWMAPDPARPGVVFKPDPRAIKIVIDAFAIAPLANPDQRPGVNLHVDLGPTSVLRYVTGATTIWGALSRAGEVPFEATLGSFDVAEDTYSWSAVDALKALHFAPAKRGAVFHYAVFANNFTPGQNGGISRGIDAADFIVTLGDWPQPGGTLLQQTGTFIHELGHNLGLRHGGGDDLNNKPNYLSVMNYSFQNVGVVQPPGDQRSFDYSRSVLPPLDEKDLDEFVGINDPQMHLTFWNKWTHVDMPEGSNKCLANRASYFKLFFPTDALDWNCDGLQTAVPVVADINGDGRCVTAGRNGVVDSQPGGDDVAIAGVITAGVNRICETTASGDDDVEHKPGSTQTDVLTGFNDWPAVVFEGGGSIGGLGAGIERPATTNDEPSLRQILDVLPDGVQEEELVAPLDVVTVAPQSGAAPLPVDFDGSTSIAIGGTIAAWEWDFGDGATGSGPTPLHTYTTPGDYFASLTVTDSTGRVNLVPLLQQVHVFDGTMPTATPAATPTLLALPTTTATPPPGSTATRTATPVIVATSTPAASPTPTLGLVVTTTADNGDDVNPIAGSLRQTIVTANAKANPVGSVDVITFDIPGAGVHTIVPPTRLPPITDPVTIDGYTQPGASPNTRAVGNDAVLLIEINFEQIHNVFSGMPTLHVGGSTIRGLVINRLRGVAIPITSDNNVVEGCFIGINPAGDARLIAADQNSADVGGIQILQGANNRIGGTLPAARNVIVGNGGFDCIDVVGGVISNTLIQGNYIGTNAAGTAALNTDPASGFGIGIGGANTTNTVVGGTQPGAGNLISGNGSAIAHAGFGIVIGGPDGTGDVTIQGNLIGTNAAGTAAIGNVAGGISVVSSGPITRLIIGGSQDGARNVVAGNGFDGFAPSGAVSAGIAIYAPVLNGAIVQGNFIGVGSDGVTLIPNFVDGIGVQPPVGSSYLIGGTNPGEGNVIAGNAGHGIQVAGFTDVPYGPVAILGNSIFSNGGLSIFGNELGIDLQGRVSNSFQVLQNDPCDADEGPNGLQNYPVLTTAESAGGATTMAGTLDSTPGTQFRIEFFSSPSCDPSGNGEGRTFIGATNVTTAAGPCIVFPPPQPLAFGAMVQPAVAVGQFITATATGPNGNTSEFSGCVQVTGTGPVATVTPGSGATPSATGPAPTRTPAPENCYDCIDNDGDGKVDRDDDDCPARANGMQLGLGYPGKPAKAVVKCSATLAKAGGKFSAARLQHLQKCLSAAFVCVQQRPNDDGCIVKAKATCAKELAKTQGDEGKLRRAVSKACAAPAVDVVDLNSVAGIGYESEVAVCGERGIGTLESASDVAACLIAELRCRTENLVADEMPRAAELFGRIGRDPTSELPCLGPAAVGARGDLGAAKGKLATKCQKAIAKGSAKFATAKTKATQKCANAVYSCVQVRTSDAKCRSKATTTCHKQLGKLVEPRSGAAAKLASAISKACGKAPLDLADVLGDAGLGFAELSSDCAALGIPSLTSLADVTSCLERQHACRVEQMIETELPRIEELLEPAP